MVGGLQELKEMDADLIFSKQLKQIEKEKKDKEMKLKSQEKKVCPVMSALMVDFISADISFFSCSGGLL